MKIGYFGDGFWAHLAIEKLSADDRFEIAYIVPRYDKQDPVLRKWAKKLGVPFLPLKSVNSGDSLSVLSEYKTELNISMSFNQILRREILALPPKGFINCHAGELPYYRGRSILTWALINDEPKFGVTVHYIDEGIDTGDIILQKTSLIEDKDDYGTILQRAATICSEVLFDAVCLIHSDNVIRKPQTDIHTVGFYCTQRGPGDELINWNTSSRKLFNFVRALATPGPIARSYLNQKEFYIEKVEEIQGAPHYLGIPGAVVAKQEGFPVVKTGDSTIKITKLNNGNLNEIKVGNRFGSQC